MNPIFTRSVTTVKILELFNSMSLDAPMSFADAGKRLGFKLSATSGAYHSARRIATKEHGIVIEGIRSFGFKRLTGRDIAIGRSAYHEGALRRRAKRGAAEMVVALGQNLERDVALRAGEALSRLRIVSDLTSPLRAQSNRHETPAPEIAQMTDNRSLIKEAFQPSVR